jgi:23S rRNA-/tRNA-specific pseudouridylate synthase
MRQPRFVRPREFAVLYEDDAVVALQKPAGLPAVRQGAFVVHSIDRGQR